MKSNIFKKAHKLTKEIIRKGDSYKETFRLALSFAHSLLRKGEDKMIKTVTDVLIEKGYYVWQGGQNKRIYLNDFVKLAKEFGVTHREDKEFRKIRMYYDVNNDTFYIQNKPSWTKKVDELIEAIRNK